MLKKAIYFSQPVILSYENHHLVARFLEVLQPSDKANALEAKPERRFVIEDLGFVVLDHWQITLTHPLLAALAQNNVAVISCDHTHHPIGLHLPLYANTLQSERYRAQIEASEPQRKQLWAQLIRQKIKNQAAVLASTGRVSEAKYLMAMCNSVKSGDTGNVEAKASARYWQHLFGHIEGFTRKRDGPPPNPWLNYGYAILRAIVARALVASGLLPTLGLHHHNRYNPFCLADDMMEPFRPYVDLLVHKLVGEFGVREGVDREIKAELLSVPYIDVEIEDEESPLMIAVQYSCQSLVKCFDGESRKLALPLMG